MEGNAIDSKSVEHYLAQESVTSTLGILWDSKNDILHYKINLDLNETRVTKRTILSCISQIFAPLGLVGQTVTK